MTLEKYFKKNYEQVIEDFNIHIAKEKDGKISFNIHPDSYDSDTLDFIVDLEMLLSRRITA